MQLARRKRKWGSWHVARPDMTSCRYPPLSPNMPISGSGAPYWKIIKSLIQYRYFIVERGAGGEEVGDFFLILSCSMWSFCVCLWWAQKSWKSLVLLFHLFKLFFLECVYWNVLLLKFYIKGEHKIRCSVVPFLFASLSKLWLQLLLLKL